MQKLTTEEFISKARNVHKDKFSYSLAKYINSRTKVEIICPKHGSFWQTPANHLSGCGCQKCGTNVSRHNQKTLKTTEQFIQESKKIFGNKFDYSKTVYINARTKILLRCNDCGNEICVNPHTHLAPRGCPYCKQSTGEQIISRILNENNIKFVIEKKFDDLKDKTFLRFDFYVPNLNTLIEFQGEQHYKKAGYDSRKKFLLRKHHDWLKRKFCADNNIRLLYVNKNNLSQLISQLYMSSGSSPS